MWNSQYNMMKEKTPQNSLQEFTKMKISFPTIANPHHINSIFNTMTERIRVQQEQLFTYLTA